MFCCSQTVIEKMDFGLNDAILLLAHMRDQQLRNYGQNGLTFGKYGTQPRPID